MASCCRGPTRVENHGAPFWGVAHLVSSIRVVWGQHDSAGSWLFCLRDRVVMLAFRLAGGPSWDDVNWEDWNGGMAGA